MSRNAGPEQPRFAPDGTPVVVRRSARRKRTVSAFWEGGTIVVAVPARFTHAQEDEWVQKMLHRLKSKEAAKGPNVRNDVELASRAKLLSERHLGGRAVPSSVRWVSNQNSRWGSATPADRSIRLSDELQGMPEWVVDYVLVHELSHLLVAGHGPRFWEICGAYPEMDQARAFLEGVAYAQSRGLAAD
ncbi:YgjP-like metallopeptidase domain-containing protein [Arthrobacter sp. NPDC090010]|uniref:YgjP-like metallopeptidase domain-containing protein n=1 Tax=Arthrobacter sp. NPDC090010 TaxID=3363942 RepID=UPI00382D5483